MWLTKQYRENRATFPATELAKYPGHWVAFSPDGSRILASAEDFSSLEDRLKSAGYDMEAVVLERIEADDIILGGAEFQ